MGSRIAAHLANAGFPSSCSTSSLPEQTPRAPKSERNKIVLAALDGLEKIQARGLLLARLRPPHHHWQLRRRPRPHRRLRLDHRSGRREHGDQARSAQQGPAASPRRLHHHQQHQRPAHPRDRRRHAHGAAPPLVRHALLQSPALHAPARGHPHPRLRPRRHRRHRAPLRHAPRQGHRPRARHAELHRQPHRHLLHGQRHPPHAGAETSPSKRSTPSPARRSAGPRPAPSASATWSASTSWPT